MKFKIGDLVRVRPLAPCLNTSARYVTQRSLLDGMVGMVTSRYHHWPAGPIGTTHRLVYRVYLTNLQCREIPEEDLEKL